MFRVGFPSATIVSPSPLAVNGDRLPTSPSTRDRALPWATIPRGPDHERGTANYNAELSPLSGRCSSAGGCPASGSGVTLARMRVPSGLTTIAPTDLIAGSPDHVDVLAVVREVHALFAIEPAAINEQRRRSIGQLVPRDFVLVEVDVGQSVADSVEQQQLSSSVSSS